MSGAMRKIGEYLGLLEDTGRYDDYDGDVRDPGRPGRGAGPRPARRVSRAPPPCPTSPSAVVRLRHPPEW